MKLITRQSLANEAAELWARQYPPVDLQAEIHDPQTIPKRREWAQKMRGIFYDLQALGPTPNPDAVDTIIGNKTWTQMPVCSECGSTRQRIMRFVENVDHDADVIYLCKSCLETAMMLIDTGERTNEST